MEKKETKTKSFFSWQTFRKKSVWIVISHVILLSLLVLTTILLVVNSTPSQKIFTILHTNDTHGRPFYYEDDAGKSKTIGATRMKSLIERERKANPNTLLFDAGDTFFGSSLSTATNGLGPLQIMNDFDYTAMVAGNHEFDKGTERLEELNQQASFPILSANTFKESNNPEEESELLLPGSMIIRRAGIKFGVFGLTTPKTKVLAMPSGIVDLTFADLVTTVKPIIDDFKAKKVDVIIALGHLLDEEIEAVANAYADIDLFITGHKHIERQDVINGVPIVQAGKYFRQLGKVKMTVVDDKVTVEPQSIFSYKTITDELIADPSMLFTVNAIKKEYDKIANRVIKSGVSAVSRDYPQSDTPGPTPLGTLLTNLMIEEIKKGLPRTETRPILSLYNKGGIRDEIEAGDLTWGEILNVLPFSNDLVTIEVTGKDLHEAIKHGISGYPDAKGKFPLTGGFLFEHNGEEITGLYLLNSNGRKGSQIQNDESQRFILGIANYLKAGGDGYEVFADKSVIGNYGLLFEILKAHYSE